VTSEG